MCVCGKFNCSVDPDSANGYASLREDKHYETEKVAALGLATAMAFSVTACSSKPAETNCSGRRRQQQQLNAAETVKEAIEGKDPAEVKLVFLFTSSLITS